MCFHSCLFLHQHVDYAHLLHFVNQRLRSVLFPWTWRHQQLQRSLVFFSVQKLCTRLLWKTDKQQRPSAEHHVPRVAPEKQNQLTFRILLGISVLTSDPLWILGTAEEIEDLQVGKLVREELQMEN